MINKLTLEGFKCFEKAQSFDLKSINILTGYNGAGKSTVFQSLLLLAQSLKEEQADIRTNGCYVKLGLAYHLFNVDKKQEAFSILIEAEDNRFNLAFQYGKHSNKDRMCALTGFILNGKDQFSTPKSIGIAESGSGGNVSKRLDCLEWQFLDIFKQTHYISADRRGPQLFEKRSDIEDRNPLGQNGEHILEYLNQNPEFVERIAEELSEIMESSTGIYTGNGDSKKEVLSLSFAKNGHHITSINTGFGYSYILPLLLAVEIGKGGMVFIENPEAHLHPRAQSKLIQILAKRAVENGIQLFIETHSEHIINGIRLASILETEKNPVTVNDIAIYFFEQTHIIYKLEIDENAQLSPWPEGFFDQAQKDISDILKLGLLK